jgi:FMN phosphatase YigB (HAD superfamily)
VNIWRKYFRQLLVYGKTTKRMNVISVDLDDTLISTKIQYERTREWFGEYLENCFGVSREKAMDKMSYWSEELLDTYGLSRERYPKAAVRALDDLVGEYRTKHERRVYEIARSTFKNEDQYRKQGFMEGEETRKFLDTVEQKSDVSMLLTSGDPRLQQRKINALNLEKWFDVIEVSDIGGKPEFLFSYSDATNLIHIGNSTHSDVKAASKANADCIHIPRGEWIKTKCEYEGEGSYNKADDITEAREILKTLL